MHAMQSPAVLLFGPQLPRVMQRHLSELRESIVNNPRFAFLVDTISELPSLWPTLQQACPQLSNVPGATQLQQLVDFLETGNPIDPRGPNNIVLAPLTVLSQVIEYMTLGREGSPQGFCVGFLSAAVVAAARNKKELEDLASTAIRLSVCIGAAVDLDERTLFDPLDGSFAYSVRWTTDKEKAVFERSLKSFPKAYVSCITDPDKVTVTIPARDQTSFSMQLSDGGVSIRPVGLRGRYHLPTRIDIVQQLKDFCNRDQRFQLPHATQLVTGLRSNSNGKLITSGALHDIALDSALTLQCNWFQTVENAISSAADKNIDVISIGTQGQAPILSSQQPKSYSGATATPIAVIGMGCRFPKSQSIEQFWKLIHAGETAVGKIPEDRFKTSELWREPKGPFFGNFLQDPNVFDHRFFKISGREAKSMDPQQRLLLQVAYEALESAGYSSKSAGQPEDIGCYIGVGAVDYEANVASENATAFSATGTLRAFISGKVSHHFGWTGPSITFDTACSSSAVAIHSACKAIQAGECSMAVAGGVNVITSPDLFQNLGAASFLNPTGASRAFDADANGYCRGEGAGVVILKPLAQAIADDDFILGVIGGSAVNQGSNCSPITVPDSGSQSALYRNVLAQAGIGPEDVSYVEAHGTGTQVGDPIECESVRRAFGSAHRAKELFIGSVKDNIGHAEAASGAAGLLKALLMIQKRTIPKQANFKSLNPKISPLKPDHMDIATKSQPWGASRLAALVNNYGAAGSNAAILIQEYVRPSSGAEVPQATTKQEFPIYISARTPESLREYCASLKSYLAVAQQTGAKNVVANLAFNLARKQNRELDYSWTSTAFDVVTLSEQLGATAAGLNDFTKTSPNAKPVVLCFGGQNGRTVSLSEELFNSSSVLQTHLVKCDAICQNLGLPNLFPRIFDTSPIEDVVQLHCMLFAIQYSSARAWIDCGLKVDTVIGHSLGQLTALCVAGSISLADALRLISERALLIQNQWGPDTGVMLAVEGDRDEVDMLLEVTKKSHPSFTADIACYNSPRHFVIAGTSESIDAVENVVREEGGLSNLKIQRLRNSHAYHSQLTDNILFDLRKVAASIDFKAPSLRIETCSKDQSWATIDAEKIVQHTRSAVYFTDAVERTTKRLGSAIWIEAGSASPIIPMVKRVLKFGSNEQHVSQPIDLGGPTAQSGLAKITSNLWANGLDIQFWPFHRSQKDSYEWVNLPPYQFERNSHWMQYKPNAGIAPLPTTTTAVRKTEFLQLLKDRGQRDELVFAVDHTNDTFKYCVEGHAVLDQPLCPAAMYFELAMRAAKTLTTSASSGVPHIKDLQISSPLPLSPAGHLSIALQKHQTKSEEWKFTLFTSNQQGRTDHAHGSVALLNTEHAASRFSSLQRLVGGSKCEQIMQSPDGDGLNGHVIYKVFGETVNYASYYRGVRKIVSKDFEVVGHIRVPEDQPKALEPGLSDPVAVDNFLQVAGIHVNCLSPCKKEEVFVCTAIAELSFGEQYMKKPKEKRNWTVYSNFERTAANKTVSDIFVIDPDTQSLVLIIMGAQFTAVPIKGLARTLAKANNSAQLAQTSPVVEQPQPDVHPGQLHGATETNGVNGHSNGSVEHQQEEEEEEGEVGAGSAVSEKVREMLHELLEMPIEEIQLTSALPDIGVDSLMSTEVAGEVQKRFNVDIPGSDLAELADVQALCNRITPSDTRRVSKRSVTKPKTSSLQPNRTNGVVNGHANSNGISPDDKGISEISRDLLTSTRSTYDSIAEETGLSGFGSIVYPRQAQLVATYIVEVFRGLGCSLEAIPPGSRLPSVQYISKHEQVMGQYYDILERAGLIARKDGLAYRTEKPVPRTPAVDLSKDIVAQFPRHASEHKLLHTTGPHLAACLTGKTDPLSLIFRDAKARTLLEDVYTNAPMFKTGTIFLARYLINVFNRFEGNRPIKVLELGAGTGGTTNYLVSQLVTSNQKFEYTFTDLSSSLVNAAKKKFAKYDFMRYAVVDIEQDPAADLLNQFDVVISTNCIHATRNLVRSTTNIQKVLRNDGILCLIELTNNLFWFDLVFGLLEGWWLFDDGRAHALASPDLWNRNLRTAGFNWVDWTEDRSIESEICRLIVASPSSELETAHELSANSAKHSNFDDLALPRRLDTRQTVSFKADGDTKLDADIYFPKTLDGSDVTRPVALMIHGGGHVMLSRRDIRPQQTQLLLDQGFLPVSIDYRLCPEVTLLDGPMRDVCDALKWVRNTLPTLNLKRRDIKINGDKVVAVGWSTGGTLAMTLGWIAPAAGVKPPEAILSFYCPTDYEDPFWLRPNLPRGSEAAAAQAEYDIWEGVYGHPITAYNVPGKGGHWMSLSDPRSRIALHMNWKGRALHFLINGLNRKLRPADGSPPVLPDPTLEQIQAISPASQVRKRNYNTPTFIIHGTQDDLIPWEQAKSTYTALKEQGVVADLRLLDGALHLFDIFPKWEANSAAAQAVQDGYRFLCEHVGLSG